MTKPQVPPDEDEPISCSECCAEPASELQVEAELEQDGWDFAGEFGPRCPECVNLNPAPEQTEGLEGVATTLGATKSEDKPRAEFYAELEGGANVVAGKPRRVRKKKEK
jgi:hypothetical protein